MSEVSQLGGTVGQLCSFVCGGCSDSVRAAAGFFASIFWALYGSNSLIGNILALAILVNGELLSLDKLCCVLVIVA